MFIISGSIFLGGAKPTSKRFLSIISKAFLPVFRHKNLKMIWSGYKAFLTAIIKHDNTLLNVVLTFFYKTWPYKFPDKLCLLVEFIEGLYSQYPFEISKILVFRKLVAKLIACMKDSNVIVADKCLIIFKHDDLVNVFINDFNFGESILKNIVSNIKLHWSEDIKTISKLVLSKLKNNHGQILESATDEVLSFINSVQFNQDNDDLWEILKFDLRAD